MTLSWCELNHSEVSKTMSIIPKIKLTSYIVMPSKLERLICLLICWYFLVAPVAALAETPEEWVTLGRRVHGGFGSYIALGIRIGLDAIKRLDAKSRDLDVTYFDGMNAPCPCVVDGIMIATVATPGQNSLRVIPSKSNSSNFGVVVIKNKKQENYCVM
ncbi:formylmethanofuran dehydrogenase subunit E family protein [Halotia branconii]|uniref:Formylmethanofuran dehydrogenase subunit E family protein n=1 Tax=Halotia branconii CENA392 TaxID=1539056 RepID=A0AAJ6NS08_9CYAN|nr:formylmethanofuran dehydrogenase subunit E family protein [Halotia branconii]WGV25493.1 formylmethanofuran dehydrogenase subunit E family protein [Halotia branconii CENA392]